MSIGRKVTIFNNQAKKRGEITQRKIDLEIKISNSEKATPFFIVTSYAAKWAQILTFFAVVFGYFYTVIPIFQKEKLAEDVASLTIQNDEIKRKISNGRATISSINASNKAIEQKLYLKKEELRKLKIEYDAIDNALKLSEKKLRSITKKSIIAEQDMYEYHRDTIQGKNKIPVEFLALLNTNISYEAFKKNETERLAETLEKFLPDPLLQGEKNLREIKIKINTTTSEINKRSLETLYAEYKNGLEQNKNKLICNTPNYQDWESSFENAFKISPEHIELCVNHHFENLIRKNNWSKLDIIKLKKSEFWMQQNKIFKNSCSSAIDLLIESTYRKKWDDAVSPCVDRLKQLSFIVLNNSAKRTINEPKETTPPTEEELKNIIQAMVSNWN